MQCPVAKSLLPELCPLLCVRGGWGLRLLFVICAVSSVESELEDSARGRTGFFLFEKRSGNGWLRDRP
jgi:hypothetical protein